MPRPGEMPAGSGMREIQDAGKLVAGVYQDVLQFGHLDPVSNEFQGFDIDMVHEIAAAIFGDPNKVEFKVLTSPSAFHPSRLTISELSSLPTPP